MSKVNKGFELEKRDVTNEVIKILNATWLPCSTLSEIAAIVSNEFAKLADKELEKQNAEYQEALKKEQEEAAKKKETEVVPLNVDENGAVHPLTVKEGE